MRYAEFEPHFKGAELHDFVHHGRKPEILDEAPRGSAVRKDEIPMQYRKLPLLGRGMTSLVFEKDPHTVLIFTRDYMKMEYMRDTGIARVTGSYDSHRNPVRELADHPIYVMEMPKLHKLSGKNIALVKKVMAEYEQAMREMRLKHHKLRDPEQIRQMAVQDMVIHFNSQENHMLEQVWAFLINYDPGQYYMDLATRNFLQTDDGRIVASDPIVARDILDAIDNHKKAQYDQRGY